MEESNLQKKIYTPDRNSNYIHFSALYSVRGDIEKANEYAEKISDLELRQHILMMLHECVD
jgi:hypothetical protein